jgi:hypothetical protein
VGLGWTREQACAVVGSLLATVGLLPWANPSFRTDRFDRLWDHSSSHNKPFIDLGRQMAFINHELTGSGYTPIGTKLAATETVEATLMCSTASAIPTRLTV